jgi:hypothetical protein
MQPHATTANREREYVPCENPEIVRRMPRLRVLSLKAGLYK